MTAPAPHPSTHRPRLRRRLAASAAVVVAMLTTGAPAGAQYGGGVNLFVDPTRVEVDGSFDYFGNGCAAGSTVTITIDGFPGVLATTIAFDDSSYAGSDVAMPDGVVAGQDYTVRASCGGNADTAVARAVCNGGTDPVDGTCPDGQTVGGQDPTATTTTTPGNGSGSNGSGGNGSGSNGSDGNGSGSDGSGGTGGSNPDLAVTGASFAEQAAQLGVTLMAMGGFLVLFATKRRERETA